MKTVSKPSWKSKVSKFIKKFFRVVGDCTGLLFEVIQQMVTTNLMFFNLMVRLSFLPSTICYLAFGLFAFTVIISGVQWYQLGVMVCNILGVSGGVTWLINIGAGTLGMVAGFIINYYELAPDMWKLDRSFAKAYVNLGIAPDFEPEEERAKNEKIVSNRLSNWYSHNHHSLKRNKWTCYTVETALNLIYLAASGGQFVNLVMFVISLGGPESSLSILAHTITLFGAVSHEIDKAKEAEEDAENQSVSF